jgi:hypothetical protein
VTLLQIRTEIEALLRATKPEERTSYERAFLALAEIVDQTTVKQLDLLSDLRSAVPNATEHPDPQDPSKHEETP